MLFFNFTFFMFNYSLHSVLFCIRFITLYLYSYVCVCVCIHIHICQNVSACMESFLCGDYISLKTTKNAGGRENMVALECDRSDIVDFLV